MAIKRIEKELTKAEIIEVKKKAAIEKRERLHNTGVRSRYDNEADNVLSTDDFVKKHHGLLHYLADVASNYLPEHMRISCRDDMRSRALMAAGLYDSKWDPNYVNGRTRRNWMIFVVRRGLRDESRDLMRALGRTYAYSGKALINLVEKHGEESVEANYDEEESIRKFIKGLNEVDSYIFISTINGVPQKGMARILHKSNHFVGDRVRYIKQGFKDATFRGEESSALKSD